jgi:hypothetical protein
MAFTSLLREDLEPPFLRWGCGCCNPHLELHLTGSEKRAFDGKVLAAKCGCVMNLLRGASTQMMPWALVLGCYMQGVPSLFACVTLSTKSSNIVASIRHTSISV